ncbi:MAG TPA: PaaI family thioesterase [Nannocystis sp.]
MTAGAIMSHVRTHLRIDQGLCGTPVRVEPGLAEVRLVASANMAADELGLCHGGFVFGLADYAAMLAVNDPNVVLGSAQVKFIRPVRVGEAVVARARCAEGQGKKRIVTVEVARDSGPAAGEVVFTGEFVCFVLDRHVLAG